MDITKRLELINQVGEEIITEEELKKLLSEKKTPIAYDGFEPSGKLHIAQGILRAINVNKIIDSGCRFKILIADWHAWANNKLGGNLDNIKTAGKYFMEVWKASDVDMSKVEILWASDLVKDDSYWAKVMQVARHNTVNRIVRCSQIMGRSEKEALQASQILYPCMQAADIFHLDIDIAQLGMDQRKVNMLAREIGPKLGYPKPIAVHHHMLMGLGQPTQRLNEEIIQLLINQLNKLVGGIKRHESGRLLPPQKKVFEETWDYLSNTLEETRIKEFLESGEPKLNLIILEVKNNIFESKLNLFDEKNKTKIDGDSDITLSSLKTLVGKLINTLRELSKSYKEDRFMSLKMSKSKPDTAIFMTDSEEEIKRKISKAYCPEGIVEENPIMEYCRYILFEKFNALKIERPAKWGGDLQFSSYSELETAFSKKELHPMDLKQAVSSQINKLIEPVRKHFEKGKAKELLEQVKSFEITR